MNIREIIATWFRVISDPDDKGDMTPHYESTDNLLGLISMSGYSVVRTEELNQLRSLIGVHDPTGADHMEDAARLAEENDALREEIQALKSAKKGKQEP